MSVVVGLYFGVHVFLAKDFVFAQDTFMDLLKILLNRNTVAHAHRSSIILF